MTDTRILRDRIKDSGLKYNYIARKMGLTAAGLQKKIENDTEFKASEVKSLAEMLSLSTEEKEAIFFA